MSTHSPNHAAGPEEPLLDAFLRDTLPEVKLALGRQIDRENARTLPERYAQLLPESVLVVTLRPDLADALMPLAHEVERELTDSCMRHGSLYDREYRVQLHRSERGNAPMFGVSSHNVEELAEVVATPLAPAPAEPGDGTQAATAAPPPVPALGIAPGMDPDATRVEGVAPPPGWESGRFVLVAEDLDGTERETFRLLEPITTVGRRSDDPRLRSDVTLADVPHVSRRQLALAWDPRDGAPGFRIYNLGLNVVHLGGKELAGANHKQGPLRLEELQAQHTEWLPLDEPLRIGEKGPVLRVRDAGEPEADPDATRLE